MDVSAKTKSCANYMSREKGLSGSYKNVHSANCKDCAYFSTRNCGMDTADSADFYY